MVALRIVLYTRWFNYFWNAQFYWNQMESFIPSRGFLFSPVPTRDQGNILKDHLLSLMSQEIVVFHRQQQHQKKGGHVDKRGK